MLRLKERREGAFDYMGRYAKIANPYACAPEENLPASPPAFPEQGIGGGAVGGGFASMGGDPRNLRFEQGNPLPQFGLRIGAEILGREATRRVPSGSREIGFFHCRAASQAKRLAVNRQGGYSPLSGG
jgi:hypothetical protein